MMEPITQIANWSIDEILVRFNKSVEVSLEDRELMLIIWLNGYKQGQIDIRKNIVKTFGIRKEETEEGKG